MADANYRRLSPACFCGDAVRPWSGLGRKTKYCGSHSTKDALKRQPRKPKAQRECLACRGFFTPAKLDHVYCTKECRLAAKTPARAPEKLKCCECGLAFESQTKRRSEVAYCSVACKSKAWKKANPGFKDRKPPSPPFTPWRAHYCKGCGAAGGEPKTWVLCSNCKADRIGGRLIAARQSSKDACEAAHNAAGLVVQCSECELAFCPLYGSKSRKCCTECQKAIKAAHRKAHKVKRRAKLREIKTERVSSVKVFERDGWCCRLCGIATPKEKRGTYEHNAPELDHITPISKGGDHSYANVQLLCRSCNGWKSAKTMDEVELELAA